MTRSYSHLLLLIGNLLLFAVACGGEVSPQSDPRDIRATVDGKADHFSHAPELQMISEWKLEDVLDHPDTSRFEASGVAVRGDRILIVFDNLRRFASLDTLLEDAQWVGDTDGYGLEEDERADDVSRDFRGFEGITVDPHTGLISLAVEAMEDDDGDLYPVVVHWSEDGTTIEWLDYEVEQLNNGVEGLGHLEVDGHHWLAALCETGKCDTRNRGRLILRDDRGELSHVDLPKGLDFDDFSALAIDGDRLAVASQETSRVWIGRAIFDEDAELTLVTESVWNLPRQKDGDVDFCTLEGLDWLDPETLVGVSDLEKHGQAKRCKKHAESIHFFDVPPTAF